MIAKFLTIMMFLGSFSVRTPSTQPNPFDYEITVGMERKLTKIDQNFHLKFLYARDSGKYDRGHDVLIKYKTIDPFLIALGKEVSCNRRLTFYSREAVGINTQTIDIYYDMFKYFGIGYSVSMSHLKDPNLLGYLMLDYSFLKLNYRVNQFKQVFDLYAGKRYPIAKEAFIHPFIKYRRDDNIIYMQGKVSVEMSWGHINKQIKKFLDAIRKSKM